MNATYILASGKNGTLYIGVTSNLYERIWRHKTGHFEGFSKLHHCTRLVWFEVHDGIVDAIRREKALKRWLRAWKIKLIEAENPTWRDLSDDFEGYSEVIVETEPFK